MKIYIAGELCAANLVIIIGQAQEKGIDVEVAELPDEEPGTVMIHWPTPISFSGSIELSRQEVQALTLGFREPPIPREFPAPIKYSPSRYNRRANRAARNNWRK